MKANNTFTIITALVVTLLMITSPAAFAVSTTTQQYDFTEHWAAILAVIVFAFAYLVVIGEEVLHLRKSKPVIVASGIIWSIVALIYIEHGDYHAAGIAVRHNLVEYAELFLFLLAAMTYINTMEERGVFHALKAWLINRSFSLKAIYWVTGILAFVISPVADNLTTALLMSAVIMAVGHGNNKYIGLGCINIVVAANAGGAFSPFGDITTLMVWQKGIVQFEEFFALLIPSVINWLIPAVIISFAVPDGHPHAPKEQLGLKYGAFFVIGLFIVTISLAVCAHSFLHLPPVIGMMTGLGLLKLFGYYLKIRGQGIANNEQDLTDSALEFEPHKVRPTGDREFDVFKGIERAEWDTLMFFYGIILCVGGLGSLGYLAAGSELLYGELGATTANVLVGIISAIVDNIPVMFAVLAMNPQMELGQWLLVTLTAGVGGSLLSVGSAAGVAVMGQCRGFYTFFSHLKWSWAIGLGYAASIIAHLKLNAGLF